MKKSKFLLLMAVVVTAVLGFLGITKVNAQTYYETLVEEKIPGHYYTRRGGGKPYMSAQYSTYTMNGKVVYCIEPGAVQFIQTITHYYKQIAFCNFMFQQSGFYSGQNSHWQ